MDKALRVGLALGVVAWLVLASRQVALGAFSPLTLAAVALVGVIAFLASSSVAVAAMAAFLLAAVVTPIELGSSGPVTSIPETAAAGLALASGSWLAARGGAFSLSRTVELRIWRLAARPFALLFIPIDLAWGRRVTLLVIGIVALAFIGMDLVRLGARRQIQRMYKRSEAHRFSSMTFFLVSVFIGFLVFHGPVPYLPLAFTTMGDLCGKLFGLRYGRTRLYHEKTLQGSLGFLAGSLMTGWAIYLLVPMPITFVLAGVPFATIVELLSERLDDNFSVSLLTGGFLAALQYFFRL
jgi:dolichol kinase